ncbi:ArsR/SmtB family transcription factor [Roseibium sp.]|uniref:ArsR/SmtB family transcription factor n=1 Tax=Roseibium sp. TaxID=1936156 RepID=UPI003A983FBF
MAEKSAGFRSDGGSDAACAPVEQCELAKVYRALGHPARLAIIETLAKRNAACCGEIVDCMPLAQSTVSQHLQVLKETGLLTCETMGRNCRYFLNTEMLSRAAVASGTFFNRVSEQHSACLKVGGCADEDQKNTKTGNDPREKAVE